MFLVDQLILVAGVLLLLGATSSKFSARLGVPVLVLFLALGMLAGSEGIGGIEFESYTLAHGVGTLALAVILFDGGLQTPYSSVRLVWKAAFLLATVGVLITAVVTGVVAAWVLDLTWLEGMVLGSIVGSTDAAAVFAVLRYGGVHLSDRLASTLEVESASNDPMAIFLTVGCLEVLSGRTELGPGLLTLLLMQMGVGALVGLAIGKATAWIVNRINLDTAGLYPVLITACGLLAYGVAVALGGSGFLSVYLAGVVVGNSSIVFKRGILLFHDATAWFGQIVMFVVLGLLSFPSRLLGVAGEGLLIAAALIFVARPAAIVLTLFAFRLHWRERVFLCWVGLKGAVPITLATFPFLYDIPQAPLLFNVVFFVVAFSAIVQGSSLPLVARWMKVDIPGVPKPPVTLELSSLRHVDGDIVDYTAAKDSRAAGRLVRELALPEGVVIAIIARGRQIIPPHGNTRIEAGDHVIVVMRPAARPLVNNIFASGSVREDLPAHLEFPLRATVTVGELESLYGISMDAPAERTLDEFLRDRLGPETAQVGRAVTCGQIALVVRGMTGWGAIESVGLVILPEESENEVSEPVPKLLSSD